MKLGTRPITVRQLPSGTDLRQKLLFIEGMESCMAQRRPCLVLDCSSLRSLDEAAVHMMLHCLEEALKRNGDVKLAAVPAPVQTALCAAGLTRLFDVYDTVDAAVDSFHAVPLAAASLPAEAAAPAL